VTGLTDVTGTATFRIEGAAQGATSFITGAAGCAVIKASVPTSTNITLTDGINHPTVIVSAPDLGGINGNAGVESTDLSVYITDKNAYTVTTANYRQRSDFDFHLPIFACSAVFNSSAGFGVNLGDLSEWVKVKNANGSIANGPFPVTCP
jgi:hypothetical protein